MAIAPERMGIGIHRHFTTEGVHPYDEVVWERRDARLTHYATGAVAFEQAGVEVPATWSMNATNILAQKYFRGTMGTAEREWSLKQVVDRIADTITAWGVKDGFFVDAAEAEAFAAEVKYMLVTQRAAFNSPVWFNIGVKGVPQQASACQPYDALVSTPRGQKPIGRLVEEGAVGTKVFDAHGLTKIVAVKANGSKRVLRFLTNAGYALEVTPDHLVWRAGPGAPGFVAAGDLRRGDRLSWHRTEDECGDRQITLDEVAGARLAGWLRSDGADAAVPPEQFDAPLEVAAGYLQSVFQAGHVSTTRRGAVVGIDTPSEPLARGLQTLLLRFGIFACLKALAGDRPWRLAIGAAADRRRFADEVGFIDPVRAGRLEASFVVPGSAEGPVKRLEIVSIEDLGTMPVFDIQTESGEYLSGNIRVHNCFILSVEDTMDSILNWYVEEGIIFKGGSGAGINLSKIRSSREGLAGGGTASGPVSFMRGADASAGTIKCLHEDTVLLTTSGARPIREALPGSLIATRHGLREIAAVHDNGERPLLRVRTGLGDEILCTPEHRFWVRGVDGEGWREAGDLRPDDFILLDLDS